MTTAIIYALILFLLFYVRNIWVYRFIIKSFKLISKDKTVVQKFLFKKNDKKIKNPRVSFLGILYFYVIIPPDVPLKYIEQFLNSQFGVVNDMMMAMDLTGAVKTTKREFIEDVEGDNYADDKAYKYIIKFHPIFWFSRRRKFLLYIITLIVSWFFIIKYGLLEYITLDSVKLILSVLKDFFSV